jgi:hypothetical protein
MPALLMFSSTSTHCQILSLHLALTQGIILRLCTRSYLHRGRAAQGHEIKGSGADSTLRLLTPLFVSFSPTVTEGSGTCLR